MGTFLSLCYTAVDTICLILFLDVFEQRRFDGLKFHLHVLEYVLMIQSLLDTIKHKNF